MIELMRAGLMEWICILGLPTILTVFKVFLCLKNLLETKPSRRKMILERLKLSTKDYPSWFVDSEKIEAIKDFSRYKTRKILSNSSKSLILLLSSLILLMLCCFFIAYFKNINYEFTNLILSVSLFVSLVFILLSEIELLCDVPNIQGIPCKIKAMYTARKNKKIVKSISISEMLMHAKEHPYILIDARTFSSGVVNERPCGMITLDEKSFTALEKGSIYYVCSDYGSSSISLAKKLIEKGCKAYSVKYAFSQYKYLVRAATELWLLKQEKLLKWQNK